MGIYRLILAILVVLSHLGISIAGFNPGVVAVISFYILSGYVMTLLIGRYYLHSGKVIHFYYDRGMRLFPQFWFYATFSFICVNVFSISSPFLVGMTLYKGILNYLLLPQAFFMYWGGGFAYYPSSMVFRVRDDLLYRNTFYRNFS